MWAQKDDSLKYTSSFIGQTVPGVTDDPGSLQLMNGCVLGGGGKEGEQKRGGKMAAKQTRGQKQLGGHKHARRRCGKKELKE